MGQDPSLHPAGAARGDVGRLCCEGACWLLGTLLFLQLFFGRDALQSACGAAGSYPIPDAGLCLALAELPEVLVSLFPGLSKFL